VKRTVRTILLMSCVFLALVKTSGSQFFVQNAIQRAQVYSGVQQTNNHLDYSLESSLQKTSFLKIHLSSHVLGAIYPALAAQPLKQEGTYVFIFTLVGSLIMAPSSIFKPPRLV
jgi:hypothetical protein